MGYSIPRCKHHSAGSARSWRLEGEGRRWRTTTYRDGGGADLASVLDDESLDPEARMEKVRT